MAVSLLEERQDVSRVRIGDGKRLGRQLLLDLQCSEPARCLGHIRIDEAPDASVEIVHELVSKCFLHLDPRLERAKVGTGRDDLLLHLVENEGNCRKIDVGIGDVDIENIDTLRRQRAGVGRRLNGDQLCGERNGGPKEDIRRPALSRKQDVGDALLRNVACRRTFAQSAALSISPSKPYPNWPPSA